MAVLITGAAGRVGSMLRHRLGDRGWALRYLDRVAVPDDGGAPGRAVVGDVADPARLDEAFRAADGEDAISAVVHLAGQPTEAPWAVVRAANIDGTFELFEAARRHGVRRVVFASSNHAVGFTPRPGDEDTELPDDLPPRPDTLYGVSKVFGEALARYYVDRYGFSVACLRIGSCREAPEQARELATWLSPADLTGLVDGALRAADLTFATVWGVSANDGYRWWSLDGTRALGYRAVDRAADRRPELVAEPGLASDSLVGGVFTTDRFGIDEVGAQGR
jgi:uronate dehydrogenase